jgi:hypothetical protein
MMQRSAIERLRTDVAVTPRFIFAASNQMPDAGSDSTASASFFVAWSSDKTHVGCPRYPQFLCERS